MFGVAGFWGFGDLWFHGFRVQSLGFFGLLGFKVLLRFRVIVGLESPTRV